jgi:hypothetical protein
MNADQKHKEIIQRENQVVESLSRSPTADQIDGQKRQLLLEHKKRKIEDFEPEAKLEIWFD